MIIAYEAYSTQRGNMVHYFTNQLVRDVVQCPASAAKYNVC